MPISVPVLPNYADRFRCIGSECEDICCKDWSIPVDQASYEKFGALPAGEIRDLILANVQVQSASPSTSAASPFAIIRLTEARQCPMLSSDHLCRIQAECGTEYLSHVCNSYPRIAHSRDGLQDVSLTFSCPEAARVVLLDPDLMRTKGLQAAELPTEGIDMTLPAPSDRNLRHWFWPIRNTVFALILNRSYPLWQRMFLLSIFCRRLDALAAGEIDRNVPDFLQDFETTLADGSLRAAMENLPQDGPAQLDVVLRLAGMLLNRSLIGTRFMECVHAFTTGIGNGPAATLDTLTAHYASAHDRYYAPFFERHPHILENYLINTIVRCQFPFGRDAMESGANPNMAREFSILVAQFTLLRGLLIGVAGYHRSAFGANHVIHTVQAAARHFEHHPEFLKAAHALLAESQMDGARGISILLRNVPSVSTPPVSVAPHAIAMRQD